MATFRPYHISVRIETEGRAATEVGPGEAFGTWALVDDSARLWEFMQLSPRKQVAFITDNAGTELLMDLALADYLLADPFPELLDPGGFDFHVQSTSPAIDAPTMTVAGDALATTPGAKLGMNADSALSTTRTTPGATPRVAYQRAPIRQRPRRFANARSPRLPRSLALLVRWAWTRMPSPCSSSPTWVRVQAWRWTSAP